MTLWSYIAERERIRVLRATGKVWPWTDDPILRQYKFTNVKRIHDRTTQAFLATYRKHRAAPSHEALYNCAVRRFFGTAEFDATVGWRDTHSAEVLRDAVARCKRPWTGAYIICAGAAGVPKVEVVAVHLEGLWQKAQTITMEIANRSSWEAGFQLMHTLPGFGGSGFMCKEVLQDYILWLQCHLSKQEVVRDQKSWTPIGPGAHRGLNRIADRPLQIVMPPPTALKEILQLQEELNPLWTAAYPSAENLTAHDVQFCLCEYDKYERVRLGQGRPRSTYKLTRADTSSIEDLF